MDGHKKHKWTRIGKGIEAVLDKGTLRGRSLWWIQDIHSSVAVIADPYQMPEWELCGSVEVGVGTTIRAEEKSEEYGTKIVL